MSKQSASEGNPFDTARRREAARSCAFGPRTAGDVARQLGTEQGSVTTVLGQLVGDGVLRTTKVPYSTGKAYELVPKWRRRLLAAVGSAEPRGLVRPNIRLLMIGAREAAGLADVIGQIAADPTVVWCARLNGPARLLVAVRGETEEERAQIDRLEAMVSRHGLDCVQLRVDDVMELAELEHYAAMLISPPRTPLLPKPGSG